MRDWTCWTIGTCILLAATAAGARPLAIAPPPESEPPLADTNKSVTERLHLLGGPLGNGDFEAGGVASRDGWLTAAQASDLEAAWHADTYGAAALDPARPDNHAYWCGRWFPPCVGDEPQAGYGDSWNVVLSWQGAVGDPAQAVAVTLQATAMHDLEPDYDFLILEVRRATGWQPLASWTGASGAPLAVVETVSLTPADYAGTRTR